MTRSVLRKVLNYKFESKKASQSRIPANEIENSFEDLQKFEKTNDMNWLVIEYFLFFWSRVMIRYGKDGEIWDNSHIIKMVNIIRNGSVRFLLPTLWADS